MANYPDSTQRRNWTFDAATLHTKCRSKHQRAREQVLAFKKNGDEQLVDGAPFDEEQDVLTMDEEATLCKFYEVKLKEVCSAFQFPHKVFGTAITYFKRFFKTVSVMEYDPKAIMLTSVYLACKIEENYVSSEEFTKGVKQPVLTVLNSELPLLNILNFDLVVFAPYRPLQGFVVELTHRLQDEDPSNVSIADSIKECAKTARAYVDHAMLTDAPLLYPPSQIALAALRRAGREHDSMQVETFVQRVVSQSASSETLSAALESLESVMEEGAEPVEERLVKDIDLKLKKCRIWNSGGTGEGKREDKRTRQRQDKRAGQEVQETGVQNTPAQLRRVSGDSMGSHGECPISSAKRRKSTEDMCAS